MSWTVAAGLERYAEFRLARPHTALAHSLPALGKGQEAVPGVLALRAGVGCPRAGLTSLVVQCSLREPVRFALKIRMVPNIARLCGA